MRDRPENSAIVKMIITTLHDLHLHAIAEGVGSAEQRIDRTRLACDEVWGSWLADPSSAQE